MTFEGGNIQSILGRQPPAALLEPPAALGPGASESFLDTFRRQRGASTDALARNQGDGSQEAADKGEAKARKAAAELVSSALILPVLKQLRQDPFGQNTIFSPGTGEKTFGPQFDMQIADRIAQSPKMAATQQLARLLEGRGPSQATAGPVKAAEQRKVARPGVNVHG